MLRFRIHASDLQSPWLPVGRRWCAGDSFIEPYAHPALEGWSHCARPKPCSSFGNGCGGARTRRDLAPGCVCRSLYPLRHPGRDSRVAARGGSAAARSAQRRLSFQRPLGQRSHLCARPGRDAARQLGPGGSLRISRFREASISPSLQPSCCVPKSLTPDAP